MPLIALFVAAFVVYIALAAIPGLGWIARIPLLGFLGSVLLVSAVWRLVGRQLLAERRARALANQYGSVDAPHMRGKLGSLHQDRGRVRTAIPLLEEARRGEPDSIEWAWRLAQAYGKASRPEDALVEVEAVLAKDDTHAYGRALLLAARLYARTGRLDEAVGACRKFEENHGEEPEGLYELARVHSARGARAEARRIFARAAATARRSAQFKQRKNPWLGALATVRSLTG